jgi:hypothetical protein
MIFENSNFFAPRSEKSKLAFTMATFTRSPFSIMHSTPRQPIATPFALPPGHAMSIQREEPCNDIQSDVGSSYSTGPPPLEDVSIDTKSQSAARPGNHSSVTSIDQPSHVIKRIHRNLLKDNTFPGPLYTAITTMGYAKPVDYAIIDLEILAQSNPQLSPIVICQLSNLQVFYYHILHEYEIDSLDEIQWMHITNNDIHQYHLELAKKRYQLQHENSYKQPPMTP